MSKEDYLILMRGRAVCIVLDTAIGLLSEMGLHVSSVESARQECMTELFYIITRIASFSCGEERWSRVYNFLVEIGISIPEDFHNEL
jgi:hypothetical protein